MKQPTRRGLARKLNRARVKAQAILSGKRPDRGREAISTLENAVFEALDALTVIGPDGRDRG